MTSRETQFRLAAAKLTVFALVSVLVTSMLVIIMGGFGGGDRTKYQAIFENASELTSGDEVRIAGVVVGKVSDVDFHGRDHAIVTFEVDQDVPLTRESTASIRFLNLIGDRYMSLSEGDAGAQRLAAGATLPLERTTPALNLTELFQGFQPLFAALRPEDVNKLSLNLIKVLQGEGGTIQDLLANTASLTGTIADRDQLIGEVITNLSSLMRTVDDHHQELDELIVSMEDWFGQLAKDRTVIGESLENISDVSDAVAGLLTQARPLLKKDVAELRRLFDVLARPENKKYLDHTLDVLPTMLSKQTRIGVYGSWYNYYLCEFQFGIVLPDPVRNTLPAEVRDQLESLNIYSQAERCR